MLSPLRRAAPQLLAAAARNAAVLRVRFSRRPSRFPSAAQTSASPRCRLLAAPSNAARAASWPAADAPPPPQAPAAPRCFTSTPVANAGLGTPVGSLPAPTAPLPDDHELTWDDGSAHPEPCIDDPLPSMSSGAGVAWLAGGFALFGLIAAAAAFSDKKSRVPYAPKEFPYPQPYEDCLGKYEGTQPKAA